MVVDAEVSQEHVAVADDVVKSVQPGHVVSGVAFDLVLPLAELELS